MQIFSIFVRFLVFHIRSPSWKEKIEMNELFKDGYGKWEVRISAATFADVRALVS